MLQCGFVECLKAIFYYTSCQPNWSMVLPSFLTANDSVTISYPRFIVSSEKTSVLDYESMQFDQPPTCSVIGKLSMLFNTGAYVFFTLACFVRFYLIVIKKGQPHQETPNSSHKFILFTLLGFAVTGALFALTLGEHFAFTRTCLAPDTPAPPMGRYATIYFSLVLVDDIIVLVLYLVIIITVTKSKVSPSTFQVKMMHVPHIHKR